MQPPEKHNHSRNKRHSLFLHEYHAIRAGFTQRAGRNHLSQSYKLPGGITQEKGKEAKASNSKRNPLHCHSTISVPEQGEPGCATNSASARTDLSPKGPMAALKQIGNSEFGSVFKSAARMELSLSVLSRQSCVFPRLQRPNTRMYKIGETKSLSCSNGQHLEKQTQPANSSTLHAS